MTASAQTISANMTLIVVTLLAATLIVVVPTWKRFLEFLDDAPAEHRRASFQVGALFISPPALAAFAAYLSLLISSEAWFYYLPDVFILIMVALTLPIILYLIPRSIIRELRFAVSMSIRARNCSIGSPLGRFVIAIFLLTLGRRVWRGMMRGKPPKRKSQMDPSKGAGVIGALGCFVLTIVLGLFVAMAAIEVAIGVEIGGQPPQDNFEFARAMIIWIR